MDAFLLALKDLSVLVLPTLGALVLIFLLFLLYRLYLMMKKVDVLLDRVNKTMDIVDKELTDLQVSLGVLTSLANGIITVQNFTKHSVTTVALFLVEHFETIKAWVLNLFDKKSETTVVEEPEEERNAQKGTDMEDIKKTLEKVVESGKDIAEDIKLKENFEKAKDVTLDAVDKVVTKFEEIKNDEELKAKIKEKADDVVESSRKIIDDIKENENVQKVVETVKEGAKTVSDKTVEFFEKPEVQEKIEEVKDKTLDIAEKGVSKLREWLKPDEKDEEE